MQEMTQEQQRRTEEWFVETGSALIGLDLQIASELDAASQMEKNDWLQAKGQVVGALSLLQAAEEAFFVKQTLTLRPPTQSVIDETLRQCEAVANEIANANQIKSVIKLASDLFQFVTRILS